MGDDLDNNLGKEIKLGFPKFEASIEGRLMVGEKLAILSDERLKDLLRANFKKYKEQPISFINLYHNDNIVEEEAVFMSMRKKHFLVFFCWLKNNNTNRVLPQSLPKYIETRADYIIHVYRGDIRKEMFKATVLKSRRGPIITENVRISNS